MTISLIAGMTVRPHELLPVTSAEAIDLTSDGENPPLPLTRGVCTAHRRGTTTQLGILSGTHHQLQTHLSWYRRAELQLGTHRH